ncbi:MAG: purine-nucleoside phosphorylase [Lachnospiraceae bacterium]|nr:purine-nucleoside phosphorylase [Lachnospiraceae bacterium]MBR3762069.1 purine-nucleoside phosphorylase [Lachnospiraceae bacterium]
MNKPYTKLLRCFESIKERIPFIPKVALILGSGLGDYGNTMDIVTTIPYGEIEEFPQSTVQGHKGQFIFGYVGKVPVVCMQGRVHFYEGYPITDVVLPIRLMKLMGAEVLFLTNAAGGVNEGFEAGDLMLIEDHICMVPNPLIGENMSELGPRFNDMSDTYDKALRDIIKATAYQMDINLREGVYVQFTGPSYETPAEVRMARVLGGDAVGMSTAVEAIAANHMGMHICGISCITNMAAGIQKKPLDHAEVQETAERVAKTFSRIVTASIIAIADAIS